MDNKRDEDEKSEERKRKRDKDLPKKMRKKKKRSKRDDDDDISSRSSSSRDNNNKSKPKRRHHRHHHRRRRRRYDDNDDSSSSSSSSSSSDDSRSRRRKRHKEKNKKTKKSKKSSSSNNKKETESPGRPVFGQYGILKSSDMTKVQRSFSVWVAEVKGMPNGAGKYELQKLFEEYREDYNTATLPHVKYCNYDQWELEEHQRQSKSKRDDSTTVMGVRDDEAQHRLLQRQKAAARERAEQQALIASMDRDKVADMKRQADLRTQMQLAFKMGDKATYQRLKDKLEPDDPR